MKLKILSVILCFALVFIGGISVAYYNTKTFGFDENAKVFSYDDKKFSLFDYSIYYDDVDSAVEKVRNLMPEKQYLLLQNNI